MNPQALEPRIFEVVPLFVVPSLVSGSQPDSRRDDIDGTVAQDEPLGLRFGKDHEAAAIRSLVAVDFAAGKP